MMKEELREEEKPLNKYPCKKQQGRERERGEMHRKYLECIETGVSRNYEPRKNRKKDKLNKRRKRARRKTEI